MKNHFIPLALFRFVRTYTQTPMHNLFLPKLKCYTADPQERLYSNHLKTGLVRYSNVGDLLSNGPVFEWWSENRTENPVYGPKCPVFKWFAQVMWLPFEYRTACGIQVFSFQMVTVMVVFASQPIYIIKHNLCVYSGDPNTRHLWYGTIQIANKSKSSYWMSAIWIVIQ